MLFLGRSPNICAVKHNILCMKVYVNSIICDVKRHTVCMKVSCWISMSQHEQFVGIYNILCCNPNICDVKHNTLCMQMLCRANMNNLWWFPAYDVDAPTYVLQNTIPHIWRCYVVTTWINMNTLLWFTAYYVDP